MIGAWLLTSVNRAYRTIVLGTTLWPTPTFLRRQLVWP